MDDASDYFTVSYSLEGTKFNLGMMGGDGPIMWPLGWAVAISDADGFHRVLRTTN